MNRIVFKENGVHESLVEL